MESWRYRASKLWTCRCSQVQRTVQARSSSYPAGTVRVHRQRVRRHNNRDMTFTLGRNMLRILRLATALIRLCLADEFHNHDM